MLKAMFEQFISEYDIYPYTCAKSKQANASRYICKSDKTSICFVIMVDTAFPYRWTDIVELVHKDILHITEIKVF